MSHQPAGARPMSSDAARRPPARRRTPAVGRRCRRRGRRAAAGRRRRACTRPAPTTARPVPRSRSAADARQTGEDHRVVQQDHEVADQDDREDRGRVPASGHLPSQGAASRPRESRPFRVPPGPPSPGGGCLPSGCGRHRCAGRDPRFPHHAPGTHHPPAGGPARLRRQPPGKGLRREEVALLAGVSIDYYIRMERGDLAGASEAVLDGLANALQLDEAERTTCTHWPAPARRPRRAAPRPSPATVRPASSRFSTRSPKRPPGSATPGTTSSP